MSGQEDLRTNFKWEHKHRALPERGAAETGSSSPRCVVDSSNAVSAYCRQKPFFLREQTECFFFFSLPNLKHQRAASMSPENWWWASVLLLLFIFFPSLKLNVSSLAGFIMSGWHVDMSNIGLWGLFFSNYLILLSGSIKPINFCYKCTPSWVNESLVKRCIIKANILKSKLKMGLYLAKAEHLAVFDQLFCICKAPILSACVWETRLLVFSCLNFALVTLPQLQRILSKDLLGHSRRVSF